MGEDSMNEGLYAVLPQEILDARERRAARQQAVIARGGTCFISFTLNIAGPIKLNPLIQKSFFTGIKQIENQLKRRNITILHHERFIEKTGCEALFSVTFDAVKVKRMMVAIEDGFALGRLFDIDVLSREGSQISRSALGLTKRTCLICDFPAHECARSQRHEPGLLQAKTKHIMQEYFLSRQADMIASCACRSMLYEVCVTPKPGLVDRRNSGSHQDMDIFTFLDSTAVLTLHFRKLFLLGYEQSAVSPSRLLERLRYAGMLAEDDMLTATNRVNTHKGLIFSLGILCAALGWSEANHRPTDAVSLLALCGEIALPSIEKDLQDITSDTAVTAGERLYATIGNSGVRGEAAAGFPSVLNCGLSTLRKMIAEEIGRASCRERV